MKSPCAVTSATIAVGCLPRMRAEEPSSHGGTSHPKIAKSAILGWGTAAGLGENALRRGRRLEGNRGVLRLSDCFTVVKQSRRSG